MQLQNAFNRLSGAAAWRVRRLFGDDRIDRTWVAVAKRWRRSLNRPVFIGVTGSAGKTTTKELLFGILSTQRKGVASPGTLNILRNVAKTVMRVRPNHDFCVVELSEAAPGEMIGHLGVLSPSVAIVTVVQSDHITAFGSIDGLAEEMGRLVEALPSSGTAVLNADDPRVLAMARRCRSQVLTYGVSPHAQLRAEEISANWPDRLQMTLLWQGERVHLKTQLCGAHWLAAVLGAVGGALATGLTLQECVLAMANLHSFEGRMQPVATPEGVTFIRDDFKAPLWTLDACFDFMKSARAKRKIMVIGTLSDYGPGTGASKRYADVARHAQETADITIFVGPWASSVLKERKPGREDKLRVYARVQDAALYLNSITEEGDVVLLKGTNRRDHLYRIILARRNEVNCWRDDCAQFMFCNQCPHQMNNAGIQVAQQTLATSSTSSHYSLPIIEAHEQVIVGLGNPEAKYSNTPHNIGYAAVNLIAEALGLEWIVAPEVSFARGLAEGQPICLIKVHTNMNLIGGALKNLSGRMSFGEAQCLLIYDDLDLALGVVRTRLSGSAGGHRGVASILQAFQSDKFKRVKVGIGQPDMALTKTEYVVTPFSEVQRTTADQGIRLAQDRILELLKAESLARNLPKAT